MVGPYASGAYRIGGPRARGDEVGNCLSDFFYLIKSMLAPTSVTTGKAAMTSADANWGSGISWTTNKSASARNTTIAFYPGVYRGVIYISAGKTVNEETRAS